MAGVVEEDPEVPSSTIHAFPARAGPAREGGERTYQYWPFSTSDLYNWKIQTPSFSEKPQGLIESILFTHNPTWDDCQQLLQVLFTIEEHERILSEAQKNVPGRMGGPQYSLTSLRRGSPWCDPTGTSNVPKVGSISECTIRLSWLALEGPPESQLIWPK